MNAREFATTCQIATEPRIASMSVFLSDNYYKTNYGVKVLPMKVLMYPSGNGSPITIGFNQLCELFNAIPYIYTNKRVEPHHFMIMRIQCEDKEYRGNKYYESSIKVIQSDSAMAEKCESLKAKVTERIKEIKNQQSSILEDFDEL